MCFLNKKGDRTFAWQCALNHGFESTRLLGLCMFPLCLCGTVASFHSAQTCMSALPVSLNWLWVCTVVCLYVQHRVYPTSHPMTAHIGSTPTVSVKWKMDDSIIWLNLHSAWRQYWCTSISFWHYTMTTWDQGDDVRISMVSAECICFFKNIMYNFCDKKILFFSFFVLTEGMHIIIWVNKH